MLDAIVAGPPAGPKIARTPTPLTELTTAGFIAKQSKDPLVAYLRHMSKQRDPTISRTAVDSKFALPQSMERYKMSSHYRYRHGLCRNITTHD